MIIFCSNLSYSYSAQQLEKGTLDDIYTDIFSDKIIGEQISTFEEKYGKGVKIDDTTSPYLVRQYLTKGCKIEVEGNKQVNFIKLYISPQCNFNLGQIFSRDESVLVNNLTFGKFDELTDNEGDYGAGCIYMCGNAFDSSIKLSYLCPRYLNYLNIEIEVTQGNEGAMQATQTWADTMIKAKGEDWVIDGKFNEDHSFNDVARKVFKNVPITAIKVGAKIEQ
jgi:hypothetical protein